MDYNYNSCNSLIELLEKGCQNKQQKSVDIFNSKRDWYYNNITTEFRNNFAERKPKKANKKSNDNNANRRTQNSRRKDRYRSSKDKNRTRSSSQKRTINEGAA